jgi:hypothetical protein
VEDEWGEDCIFVKKGLYCIFDCGLPVLSFIGLMNAIFTSLNVTFLQTYAYPQMRELMMRFGVMAFGTMVPGAVPFVALAEKCTSRELVNHLNLFGKNLRCRGTPKDWRSAWLTCPHSGLKFFGLPPGHISKNAFLVDRILMISSKNCALK